jgi:hypothetical protein
MHQKLIPETEITGKKLFLYVEYFRAVNKNILNGLNVRLQVYGCPPSKRSWWQPW